jgi:hypothetical protein
MRFVVPAVTAAAGHGGRGSRRRGVTGGNRGQGDPDAVGVLDPHLGQVLGLRHWFPRIRHQALTIVPGRPAVASASELGRLQQGPVVRAVITMLCTWGCGRPCGPRWWSKEAATQRWGLIGENLLRPVFCRNLSAA